MTASISGGHALSRRAFLKAAGVTGLGLAWAQQVAAGTGRPPGSTDDDSPAAQARDAIADLAAALDYDAERIFRFVADQVRYEPYSGILRGARGTLASRAGNSADQALLLAALLEASLLPVRFATGSIDDATAEGLLASAEAGVETIRRHGLEALAGAAPGSEPPAPPQLTPEEQEQLDRAVTAGEEIVSWARDQLERTVGLIESALHEARVDLPGGFTTVPASERGRHVWVQVAATADWVDLDPTLPGASPGTAFTTAAEILDALPDDMAHRIELRVIGETLTGDALEERTLVGYIERSDAVAGSPITIMNTRPEALTALGVSIAGAIGGGSSYVPTIIVGDDAIVGTNPIHFAGGATDQAGDQQPGDDFFEPGPTDGETTAEWVELTIRSPEWEPVVIRREIFDRIGPARRAGGGITAADIAPVDRVDLPEGPEGEALLALTAHWLTVSTGLPGRDDAVMAVAPGEDVREGALVGQAYHLVNAAAGMELAVPAGIRPFTDAPNVIAHSLIARPAPDGDHGVETVLDIWHRSHGVGPVAGVGSALPPAVAAGVLAHIAERILGGEALAGQTDPDTPPVATVGSIFDLARAERIPWRVLRVAGDTTALAWADDARIRLEQALSEGWLAIAPERPVIIGDRERVGWWLVDPATGRTVDALDDGRGGEPLEYAVTLTPAQLAREAYFEQLVRKCIRLGILMAANAVLSLGIAGGGAYLDSPWLTMLGGAGAGHAGTTTFFWLKSC